MFRTIFRFAAMAAIGGMTLGTQAQSANKTPGQNFPIMEQQYELQEFDSNGNADEVPITDSLQDRFFYSNCYDDSHCYSKAAPGAVVFKTPSGHDHTANSDFPRMELRGMKDWTVGGQGGNYTYSQTGTVVIVTAPSTQSLIFAQIHADADEPGGEMLKVYWKNGQVITQHKPAFGATALSDTLGNLAIGASFEYNLKAQATSDSEQTVRFDYKFPGGNWQTIAWTFQKSDWSGYSLYFKAGDYNQDKVEDGSEAVVAYNAFNVSY